MIKNFYKLFYCLILSLTFSSQITILKEGPHETIFKIDDSIYNSGYDTFIIKSPGDGEIFSIFDTFKNEFNER